MTENDDTAAQGVDSIKQVGSARVLSPAAQRALAEAAERRSLRDAADARRPAEVGGREGPDPIRFGDWEKGGIAWDF